MYLICIISGRMSEVGEIKNLRSRNSLNMLIPLISYTFDIELQSSKTSNRMCIH